MHILAKNQPWFNLWYNIFMSAIGKMTGFFWRRKKLSIVIVVLAGLLIFIFLPKDGTAVETQKIKRGKIEQVITASGKIESENSVKLNFITPGKLVYAGAKKGDFVKQGQTIAALDTRTVQKNLQSSLRDYQIQRNAFDDTKENNQNRTPAQALNDDMKRVLQDNQYDLEKAILSVELQSLAREQSFLVSPINGVLTQADAVVPGVNVGVTNTYTIADPENVMFVVEVDEADIGKVRKEMPVKMLLESYPDDSILLKITNIDFVSHVSANGGNVFYAEAKLENNSNYKYRIGMSGDAEIITAKQADALIVPLGSVTDEKYVYVKNGTTFVKREVDLGTQSDTDIEVIKGLSPGEEIAVIPDEVVELQKNNKRFYFF
jgi:RND family efflux transporter MFP subunit